MSTEIRELAPDEMASAQRLGHEAFGSPRPSDDGGPVPAAPGRRFLGALVDGRLVAKLSAVSHRSWWHGADVPTLGIGGVAVEVEHRGAGLVGRLFAEARAGAEADGAALSTLYPTAPAIYRRLGYEIVTDLLTVAVPTSALAQLRAPDGVRLRRAEVADVPAVREAYREWARTRNGPLTRTGPAFPETDEELLGEFSGITLAERDGRVVGWCSFERGTGYGPESRIEVTDLLAVDPGAHLALLASLGRHASVVGRVELQTSGDDLLRLLTRTADWSVLERSPYMLAVLDPVAALEGRRWPPMDVSLPLVLADADGTRGLRLELDGEGGATCTTTEPAPDAPVLTRRGLAARFSGHWSCASLRGAGQLAGDSRHDWLLDALFTGECHVRDYF
ncbi:GNAT family N-acetyltransferase [Auraticoccus monumenti]|uniref:Predicted acetyltransferase n=1 Tax=Auraticoccus monumenti TaxID=675864 RepID=A0A1G7A7R7_9ACTN|nr:GNAT family N-acetyltransferase [Auraticoccus monumenti]SDE10924.1 Predicted acetyltransferase [Auraticoccus monumenti]